ncbi:MAG: hypothetical protein AABZ14_01880 [Candidatus Margulisiibacteriota bacterium]
MTFDMDSFIENVKKTAANQTLDIEPLDMTPLTIQTKPNLSLHPGHEYLLLDLLTGLPDDLENLQIKMFGNCTFFPFHPNKTVTIAHTPQDIHFRHGSHGIELTLTLPSGIE